MFSAVLLSNQRGSPHNHPYEMTGFKLRNQGKHSEWFIPAHKLGENRM